LSEGASLKDLGQPGKWKLPRKLAGVKSHPRKKGEGKKEGVVQIKESKQEGKQKAVKIEGKQKAVKIEGKIEGKQKETQKKNGPKLKEGKDARKKVQTSTGRANFRA
jgi:hypothetical protein